MTSSFRAAAAVGLPLVLALSAVAGDAAKNWPQWRGPLGTGAAVDADPPVEWGVDKNIRWQTALPGLGHSTPVVWGDRIFVTAAAAVGEPFEPRHSTAEGTHDGIPVTHRHEFLVVAVRRSDGEILWKRAVREKIPHEGGHYTGSQASNSAVTDGEHVFAFFGSAGLYALTTGGKVVWSKQFGEMQTKHGHGEGSSPALYKDTLVINWDHEGKSFVAALDKRTGEPRWKIERDEKTSWASPIIVEHEGKPQLIVSGTNRLRGYDLASGRVIWQCGGLASNIVATPVAGDGYVYAGSSYEKRFMLGIRLAGAEGEVSDSRNIAWSRTRGTPYVPSPLLYKDSLYFLTHYQGILTRADAKTGEDRPGAIRLAGVGNIYASPVAAADRIYVTDLEGATIVLSHEDTSRVLALNRLNDSFSASPAIVGKELFLRGQKFLYSIAEEKK